MKTLARFCCNPNEFEGYHSVDCSPGLLARLEAHMTEFVHPPQDDGGYVTIAGWPWMAMLASSEVVVGTLEWEPLTET